MAKIAKTPAAEKEVPQHYLELGSTGTNIYAGQIDEDYLKVFKDGLEWCDIADRMIRGDEQVFKVLQEVKLPIKSTNYFIEAASDDPADVEKQEYIEAAFLNQINFKEFINNALTLVEKGFSVFEVVNKLTFDKRFGRMMAIDKLAFRKQNTIRYWNFNTFTKELENLHQMSYGDLEVDTLIPAKNCLIFTINKEGDNYVGLSPLRAGYRYYLVKDECIVIQRKGFHYSATGIPVVITSEISSSIIQKFQTAITNFIKGTTQGFILPSSKNDGQPTVLQELKTSHDGEKVQKWIEYMDLKLAGVFLAQFSELGHSGGGSLALGKNMTELFLMGLESIPEMICEQINNKVIKDLIDWKYGEQDYYPRLKFGTLNKLDSTDRAAALKNLVDSNLIQVSDAVKEQIHNEFKLPVFDRDLEVGIQAKRDAGQENNSLSQHDCGNHSQDQIHRLNVRSIDEILAMLTGKKNVTLTPIQAARFNAIRKDGQLTTSQARIITLSGVLAQTSALTEFTKNASGLYTLAADVHPASKLIETEGVKLLAVIQDGLEARATKYIDTIIKKASEGAGRSEIFGLNLPDKTAFTNEVMLQLASTSVKAKDQVLKEVGKAGVRLDELTDKLDQLPKQTKEKLKYQTGKIVDTVDTGMKNAVFYTLNDNLGSMDINQLKQLITIQAARYLESPSITVGAENFAATAVNSVRNDVFQTQEVFDGIEAFQFFNPSPVSNICTNLNGTVFSKDEYKTTGYLPPLHSKCKSIIIPLMAYKKNNPSFTNGGFLLPTGSPEEINKALKSKQF